jgi:hypothetical protein
VPATMMNENKIQSEPIAGETPATEAICPVVTISVGKGAPTNPTASRPFDPALRRSDKRPESFEGAARAALDSRAGRALTDADWAVAKDRLLDFFAILRAWGLRATNETASRDLVMCEVPCLREL